MDKVLQIYHERLETMPDEYKPDINRFKTDY
jgi:hypothetical protein